MKPMKCRDCGGESTDLYWFNDKGQKLSHPRCAACHEQALRSKSTNAHDIHLENEGYPVRQQSHEARIIRRREKYNT